MYYRNAAAAIVCYDVTSPQSYETMKFWLDELHRNISAGNIVICIAACKTDLLDSTTTQVDLTEAEQMAHSMGAMFVDTSAKTNTNVISLFQKVAERVLQFKQGDTPIPVTPGAAMDEQGNVLFQKPQVNRFGIVTSSPQMVQVPSSPTNNTTSSPLVHSTKKHRRDKRTKQDDVGIEQAPSDVMEQSKSSSNMCGIETHPYLCGQRDDVGSSCTIS